MFIYLQQLILVAIHYWHWQSFDLHCLSCFVFLFSPSLFHNYYMWTVNFAPCSWVLSVRRCCKSSQLHSRCWVFVPVPKRLRGATGAAVSTSPEPPRHPWNDRLCMWGLWTSFFFPLWPFNSEWSDACCMSDGENVGYRQEFEWHPLMRLWEMPLFLVQWSRQDLLDLKDL